MHHVCSQPALCICGDCCLPTSLSCYLPPFLRVWCLHAALLCQCLVLPPAPQVCVCLFRAVSVPRADLRMLVSAQDCTTDLSCTQCVCSLLICFEARQPQAVLREGRVQCVLAVQTCRTPTSIDVAGSPAPFACMQLVVSCCFS